MDDLWFLQMLLVNSAFVLFNISNSAKDGLGFISIFSTYRKEGRLCSYNLTSLFPDLSLGPVYL